MSHTVQDVENEKKGECGDDDGGETAGGGDYGNINSNMDGTNKMRDLQCLPMFQTNVDGMDI